jgi:Domain of unknown function (DUF4886)
MKKTLSLVSVAVLALSVTLCSLTACGDAKGDKAAKAGKEMKILFIGNSLTHVNNLPGMLATLAKSKGHRLTPSSHTPGGARLFNHANNPALLKKLKTQKWDVVVLQEQSQYPGFGKRQLEKDIYPHAKTLAQAARVGNKNVTILIYLAFARKKGDPGNAKVSKDLLTYEGSQKRITACYMQIARRNRALVAPVGEVWKLVRKEKPALNLYRDNSHPTPTGTYLAACTFYTTLFKDKCTGSVIPRGIDKKTAEYVQGVVDKTVVGNGKKWDFRK